jgi:hypothetical protein
METKDTAQRNGHLATDLLKGALAGAAATWAMGRVTTYLYEREDRSARIHEDTARAGRTAYEVAAEKVARLVGRELPRDRRGQVGSAMHWALGIGAGAAYGVLRNRVRAADRANGLVFGPTFWGLVDEGANTLLRLTPGATAFPWQTHARGLAGHLVFGAAADSTLRVLDRVA